MPAAPTGIHDVASVRVQAVMGVGQPWGQAAIGSSMGAWAGLLRLLDISLALKRSGRWPSEMGQTQMGSSQATSP